MLLLKQNITILLMVMSSCLVFAKPTVNYCQTCLDVSEFIQEMEYNQTESIIKQNLFKICLKENDGSNSKVCEFLSATMQNTLKRIGDKNFCTKVNACTLEPIVKPTAHNSERCRFCTNLLESFKSLIAETNINLVKESLNYYCELTNDFKDECQKNVNRHLINFIDFLQNKVDSQTFCHAIDSCESEISYEKKLPSIGDLVSLRDPIQIADHLDFIEQQEKLALVNSTGYKNPITCLVCNEVVSIMYSQLHKNATRKHIEEMLAKSCKTIFLKDKVKERECEAKVEKNTEIIIKGFVDKVKPRVVCILIGMCFPGQRLPGDEQLNNAQEVSTGLSSRPIQMGEDFKCYFCDKVVEFLFKELDQNKTREYVRHLLEKSCSVLFKKGDRESKCEEYVDAYTDKLINLIEKVENPGLICNVLHMCPVNTILVSAWDEKRLNTFVENEFIKSSSMKHALEHVQDFKLDWCKICTIGYPILNEVVQIDVVKDEIKVLTNEFCDSQVLPIKDCRAKVDKYIDVISNVKNSDAGCKQLSLCPANKLSIDANLQIIDLALIDSLDQQNFQKFEWNKLGGLECTTCKMLIKDLYENLNHMIHSDTTKHLINRTCELIPQEEYKKECKENALKDLEELIKDITKSLPPQQVCELLEYCKPKSTNDSLSLLKLKDNMACGLCKTAFPTLHQLFQKDLFRDYVKNALLEACNDLDKPDECRKKANQLVDDLTNEETADKGCSSFCQESFFTSSIQNLPNCAVCQTSMVIIDATFSNPRTQEAIKNLLESFCNSRKEKFKSTCNNMLKDSLPKFYEIIKNLTNHDSGFCVKMGICNSSKIFDTSNLDIFLNEDLLKGAEELLPSKDELIGSQYSVSCPKCVCNGCKKVMGLVHEEVLSQRFLKDKILNALLKTCPKKDDACRKFYRKYVNGVYDTIERNTRPDKACVKLCSNELELLEPVKEEFFSTINLNKSEDLCEECKKVMGLVHDKVLAQRKLKDQILESLLKTCPKNDDACRKFYRKYVNDLYDRIETNTRPGKACETLQLCSHSPELLEPVKEEFAPAKLNESELCQECKKVMDLVHDKVVNEKTLKDQILKSLLKTCPENDDACRKFFREYINYLYDMIEKNTNPEKACAALNFCLNEFELFEPVMEEFVSSVNLNNSKICEGCRSAVKFLVEKLNDKAVVNKILEEVEINFCNPLTFVERKACTRFVKEFGPKIIKHFVSRIDEHLICNKELKLCQNFLIDNTSEEMSFDLTNFFEDPNCVKCTRSVEKLNNLRGDTDKQFTVEEICKDDFECSEFMFNFSDFFLNNQHSRDPIVLCTELDVCLIPGKVQLLGGNKCKYGAAYSCLSAAHADACKATKFCQQNYWQTVEN